MWVLSPFVDLDLIDDVFADVIVDVDLAALAGELALGVSDRIASRMKRGLHVFTSAGFPIAREPLGWLDLDDSHERTLCHFAKPGERILAAAYSAGGPSSVPSESESAIAFQKIRPGAATKSKHPVLFPPEQPHCTMPAAGNATETHRPLLVRNCSFQRMSLFEGALRPAKSCLDIGLVRRFLATAGSKKN
jgi:hypothetical protein